MKIPELIKILNQKFNICVNQTGIASCLGITRQTICNRIKNDSEVTVSEVKKIEEYFNINIFSNCSEDVITADYYPDVFASCGIGSVIFSDNKIQTQIPQLSVKSYSKNKKYSIIHARGDSMSPYICDEDKLIIEHINGEQIFDNKIYVFCYKQEFFVKRLSKNVDEVIVISDNPLYDKKVIKENDLNDLIVIGIVVGIIRSV